MSILINDPAVLKAIVLRSNKVKLCDQRDSYFLWVWIDGLTFKDDCTKSINSVFRPFLF